jgi:hypothetical protein
MPICQNDCAGISAPSGRAPENGLHVDVLDGAITLSNPAGQQLPVAGQFGFVRDLNSAPVIVPPSQGIQVTMPLSISRNAGAGKTVGRSSDLECAVQ